MANVAKKLTSKEALATFQEADKALQGAKAGDERREAALAFAKADMNYRAAVARESAGTSRFAALGK